MDFHSLTRKELQALCKKNKIPANITNVAMADALAALVTVEGLEELSNQSQSMIPESPAVPRTVTRTSTRRKPVKEEPETAQLTTRTRGRTRRVIDLDLDRENKVMDTPAAKVVTPAVQTAYNTRRSVRLLEKSLAGLSLKEAVKMDALVDETVEKDVPGNSEKSSDSSASCEMKDLIQESDSSMVVASQDTSVLSDASNLDGRDESVVESDQKGLVDAPAAEITTSIVNPIANACEEVSVEDQEEVAESGDCDDMVVSENAAVADVVETETLANEVVAEKAALSDVVETETLPSGMVAESDAVADVVETETLPIEAVAAEEEDIELPFDSDGWETDSDTSVDKSDVGDNESDENEEENPEDVVSKGESDLHNNNNGMEDAEETSLFHKAQGLSSPHVEMEEESAALGNKVDDVVERKKITVDGIDVVRPSAEEYDNFVVNLPPLPETPPSNGKQSPCHPVSAAKIPKMSPLGADSNQSTTPVKFAAKDQITDQKQPLPVANNKENILNSEMEAEVKKKKKNTMGIDVDNLEKKSMRDLKKMARVLDDMKKKKKMMKNKDGETEAQGLKTRTALQALPETNVMVPKSES